MSIPKLATKLDKHVETLVELYTKANSASIKRAYDLHQQIIYLGFLREAADQSLNGMTLKSIIAQPKDLPGLIESAEAAYQHREKEHGRKADIDEIRRLAVSTAEFLSFGETAARRFKTSHHLLDLLPQIFTTQGIVTQDELDVLLTARAVSRTLNAINGQGSKVAALTEKLETKKLSSSFFTPRTTVTTKQSAAYRLTIALRDMVELLAACDNLAPEAAKFDKNLKRECARAALTVVSYASNHLDELQEEHQALAQIEGALEILKDSHSTASTKSFTTKLSKTQVPKHSDRQLSDEFYDDLHALRTLAKGRLAKIEKVDAKKIKDPDIHAMTDLNRIEGLLDKLNARFMHIIVGPIEDESAKLPKKDTSLGDELAVIGTMMKKARNALQDLYMVSAGFNKAKTNTEHAK